MKRSYLEVTYRKGRPLAAYFYLPRRPKDRSVRTEKKEDGLVVDYAEDGRPIGIEITSPRRASVEKILQLIIGLGFQAVYREEFAPLVA